MIKQFTYILPFVFLFTGCKKDPETIEPKQPEGTVEINVTNVAGNQLLALGTGTYINQNDTFTVNRYLYYISNIKLFRDDNFTYIEKESYHLLDQADTTSCKFTLKEVPYGNYTGIEFIIGVDAARNVSGAQTGALDPIHAMFWSWSQGYIFAKMEGTCASAPLGGFTYHIGGFEGVGNSIVSAKPSFNGKHLHVSENPNKIYLKSDIMEWFKTPITIDFASHGAVMSGKKSAEIANNYADMFTVSAITHN
jgi:hypothetical protein